ncbi:MAG: hypothetical protein PHE09_06945 [Oscillospiraceae bacterium]|nr:hypothetical protein [Oscillospiraceae bacterium]
MGTPCAIGMKQADGSICAIRCNYDGYVLDLIEKHLVADQLVLNIGVLPNRESLLRIAIALLVELDESWLAKGKVYLAG